LLPGFILQPPQLLHRVCVVGFYEPGYTIQVSNLIVSHVLGIPSPNQV